MEHCDGFPMITARKNQFQRLATVLVYLNDVEEVCVNTRMCTCVLYRSGCIQVCPSTRHCPGAQPFLCRVAGPRSTTWTSVSNPRRAPP